MKVPLITDHTFFSNFLFPRILQTSGRSNEFVTERNKQIYRRKNSISIFTSELGKLGSFLLYILLVSFSFSSFQGKVSTYRTIERDRSGRESAYLNRIIPSNGRLVLKRENPPPLFHPLMLSKEKRSLIKVTRMCSACASLA